MERGPAHQLRDDAVRVTLEGLLALRAPARGADLAARRPAAGGLTGSHRSRLRGRGMDYLESRHYLPGDDIRNMDWRVTARAGHPHVKLYQEERERPVVILVDLNPSMFFASRGALKSVIAARAAAFLGWAAAGRGDRVGALLFDGRSHLGLPPAGGDRGVLRLLRALVSMGDPAAGLAGTARPGSLDQALGRLRRVARPGSLIVLISDGYDLSEATPGLLGQLRRHSELLFCRVLDTLERRAPPPGRYPVTDGEHRGLLECTDPAARAAYEASLAALHRRLTEVLRAQSIPLLTLDTADDVAAVLGSRWRRGRGRRAA